MMRYTSLHFHPERIAWIGAALLAGTFLTLVPLLWRVEGQKLPSLPKIEKEGYACGPFSFDLNFASPQLAMPDLQGKLSFSFDPARPDNQVEERRVLIRINETNETKKLVLPGKVDLSMVKKQLKFINESSLFWIDVSEPLPGQIAVQSWIATPDDQKIDAGHFVVFGQDRPLQAAQEFGANSPLRILAEAKWWGKDLLDPNESGERLEIDEPLELRQGEWLKWNGNAWRKTDQIEGYAPIARIQSVSQKSLVLEAWDAEGYARVGLGMSVGPALKMRAEELLCAIRIRSEKQISCTLEKQCMVLKLGDWALKTNGRWKVLRKKDEKDAFFNGKLNGELFILDQILSKAGQKVVQGRLFNPGRTQVLPIEMAAIPRKRGHK